MERLLCNEGKNLGISEEKSALEWEKFLKDTKKSQSIPQTHSFNSIGEFSPQIPSISPQNTPQKYEKHPQNNDKIFFKCTKIF